MFALQTTQRRPKFHRIKNYFFGVQWFSPLFHQNISGSHSCTWNLLLVFADRRYTKATKWKIYSFQIDLHHCALWHFLGAYRWNSIQNFHEKRQNRTSVCSSICDPASLNCSQGHLMAHRLSIYLISWHVASGNVPVMESHFHPEICDGEKCENNECVSLTGRPTALGRPAGTSNANSLFPCAYVISDNGDDIICVF